MGPTYFWESIVGTDGDDSIWADFNAADAIYEYTANQVTFWSRNVFGYAGDDIIHRDRPGDYKVGAHGGDVYVYGDNAEYVGGGDHAPVDNGGFDTVSYNLFGAGVDVDLDTNFSYGVAKARWTPGGETIYGIDRLYDIDGVVGSNHNDLLKGDDTANLLSGQGGGDIIEGFGGEDTILGGSGNDELSGNGGDDSMNGGGDTDLMLGGDGNDFMEGGYGGDSMIGGQHEDTLRGDGGDDTLKGGNHDDNILGGEGYNLLYGEHGHDLLVIGDSGKAWGGDGEDTLYGSNSADVLDGGNGDDLLYGYGNNDTLTGGNGEDTLDGGDGYDMARELAPGGVQVMLTGAGNGTLTAWGETDELYSIEAFETGTGDDQFHFVNGNQYVTSGGGDDFANMGAGNDTFWGGGGEDEAYGGNDADYLLGEGNDDDLFGEGGNDTIKGGEGDDYIEGGAGNDLLEGGSGQDGFVFASSNTGTDTILDFEIGIDTIAIKPGFLADHPGIGESFVGEVLVATPALTPGAPPSSLLYAHTVDGFRHFATLENVDHNDAHAALLDGSLFYLGGTGGGGAGDGGWQFPDKPGENFGGDGGFGWGPRSSNVELMPDYIATDLPPAPERDGFDDMRLGDAAGGQVLSDALF